MEPINPPQSKSKKTRISFENLCSAFENATRRFPTTVVYVALFSFWWIVEINSRYHDTSDLEYAIWYLSSVGMLLTLAISIWCEYLGRRSTIPQCIANILLIADSIYIMCCGFDFDSSWGLSRSALITGLVIAILFVPSRKSWAWNFTLSQLRGLVIFAAFSFVSLLAVGLIFLTIDTLFNLRNIDKPMFSCMVLLGFTLPAIIFLHLVPYKSETEENEREFRATKFECGTAKYFLLPLTAAYMIILYVYGINILASWELPNGGVCWSVTGLTVAVLTSYFFLEGVRRTDHDDALTLKALRYLPMALLPLLVLMSVAVIYRIGQHGLTLPRLYVLTFNIWSYCIVIYMTIAKPKVINAVALSFAIVFVTTSILPFANYKSLTDSLMRKRLINEMTEAGFENLPMKKDDFLKAFVTLSPESRSDIKSMLEYLDSYKRHENISDIIDFEEDHIQEIFWGLEYNNNVYINNNKIELSNSDTRIPLPEGYYFATREYFSRNQLVINSGEAAVMIDSVMFSLPLDSLCGLRSTDEFNGIMLHPLSGAKDSIYITKSIDIIISDEVTSGRDHYSKLYSTGILFTK